MGLKVQGIITPGRSLQSITTSTTVDIVSDNGVALFIGETAGTTVSESRQVEIIDAWRFLWNGIRDRNIMQQFAGVVYSGVDIDHIGENQRITSATFGDFGINDVFVGIGQLVVAEFLDYTLPIEVAFAELQKTALEDTFKAV
jgi:hypothetical protein